MSKRTYVREGFRPGGLMSGRAYDPNHLSEVWSKIISINMNKSGGTLSLDDTSISVPSFESSIIAESNKSYNFCSLSENLKLKKAG